MTLLEALKVAQRSVQIRMGTIVGPTWEMREQELVDAAAVLAGLEEEWPKIMEAVDWMVTMVGDDGSRWSEEERAECRGHTETLAAFLSRLDAAPKEGS